MYVYDSVFNSESQKFYYTTSIKRTPDDLSSIQLYLLFMLQMKEYAIIYCIQVLLDSVYRDMYKIYIGNKIRNLTRFYDDSYYIASHKTSTIF